MNGCAWLLWFKGLVASCSWIVVQFFDLFYLFCRYSHLKRAGLGDKGDTISLG